ncbi:hypothetical protein BOW09_08185 [Solemya velum gill symbiont]|nr:hypothetical protein BOW09_08185 [Solemya velum gill symbiont]
MMIRITTVIAMVLSASIVSAEPSSNVAYDVPTLKFLMNADPARGEALAKKEKCSKCHGDNGVSDDGEDNNIAGLMPSYAFKQLIDFRDKKRDDRDMYKKVKEMDDQQLADLAVWFGMQEAGNGTEGKQMSEDVRKLVVNGDPERLLKACAACHGSRGNGGQFDHPRINNQYKEYLVTAMTAFKEDDRENDVYSRMRYVSKALTEEEIEALADYYVLPDPE